MGTFRKRVSTVIVNDSRILGFHAEDPFNKKKYFFLSGGELEKNETREHCAIRETLEETGYKIALSKESLVKNYDFEWNGKMYTCETFFVLGALTDTTQNFVKDADYHRGVDWVRIEDIKKVFSYHSEILAAVLDLVDLVQP